MAAVNGAGSEMANFDKPIEKGTELKENQNGEKQSEIPLTPDQAAEEAKREEIRAKIRTVSGVFLLEMKERAIDDEEP
jgi:hypothetical protein